MSDLHRIMRVIVPFWNAFVDGVIAVWEWWLNRLERWIGGTG